MPKKPKLKCPKCKSDDIETSYHDCPSCNCGEIYICNECLCEFDKIREEF